MVRPGDDLAEWMLIGKVIVMSGGGLMVWGLFISHGDVLIPGVIIYRMLKRSGVL